MSVRMGRVLIAVLGYALVIFGASACDSFAEEFFPTATSAPVPTPTHAPSSIPTPQSTPTVIVLPTPTPAAKDPEFPAEPTYNDESKEKGFEINVGNPEWLSEFDHWSPNPNGVSDAVFTWDDNFGRTDTSSLKIATSEGNPKVPLANPGWITTDFIPVLPYHEYEVSVFTFSPDGGVGHIPAVQFFTESGNFMYTRGATGPSSITDPVGVWVEKKYAFTTKPGEMNVRVILVQDLDQTKGKLTTVFFDDVHFSAGIPVAAPTISTPVVEPPKLDATISFDNIKIKGSDFPPGKPLSIWVNSIDATPGKIPVTDPHGHFESQMLRIYLLPPPWTVTVEVGGISASLLLEAEDYPTANYIIEKIEDARTYGGKYSEPFTPSHDCDLGVVAFNSKKKSIKSQPFIYLSKAALYADGVDELGVCVVARQQDVLPQQIVINGHISASTAPKPMEYLAEVDFSGLPQLVDQAKLGFQPEYKFPCPPDGPCPTGGSSFEYAAPIAYVSISPVELPSGVEGLQLGRGTFTYSGSWLLNGGEYMEVIAAKAYSASQQSPGNRAIIIRPGTEVTKTQVNGNIYQTPHTLIMEDVAGQLWFGPDKILKDKQHPEAFMPTGSVPLTLISAANELLGDWADYYVTSPRRTSTGAALFGRAGWLTWPAYTGQTKHPIELGDRGSIKVRSVWAPQLFFGNRVVHEMQHEFSCYQPINSLALNALCDYDKAHGNLHWRYPSTIGDALSGSKQVDYRDEGFCKESKGSTEGSLAPRGWPIASIFTLYEMGVAEAVELPPFYYSLDDTVTNSKLPDCRYSTKQLDDTYKVEPEELAEWANQAVYKSELRGRSHYNVVHLIYSRAVLTDAEVAGFDLVARDFGKTTWDKWGVLPLGFYTQGRVVAHTLLGE